MNSWPAFRRAAAALLKLNRANAAAGRPFDLWAAPLSRAALRSAAARAARGEAELLQLTPGRPEEGLLLYAPSPRESAFSGYGCARLAGPWLRPEGREEREEAARRLAEAAARSARARGDRLLILKTGQDAAALRGLIAAGFALAELAAVLELDLGRAAASPPAPPPGFAFVYNEKTAALAEGTAAALGDFFYDGHSRHGRGADAAAAARLWRLTLLEELRGAAFEAVVLLEGARPAGAATAILNGPGETALSILALAESYRGRGLARGLLAALIARLAGRAARLRAETAAFNLPALALYQSAGFLPRPPLAILRLSPP